MSKERDLRSRAFDAMNEGRLDDAEGMFGELVERSREFRAEEASTDLAGLAGCLARRGAYAEAARWYREALEVLAESEEDSPSGAVIAASLARVLAALGLKQALIWPDACRLS